MVDNENGPVGVGSLEGEALHDGSDAVASTAIRALTQASQVLMAAAQQITQATGGEAAGIGGQDPAALRVPAAPPAQIDIWEDDPFSEAFSTADPVNPAPVTVDVPVVNAPLLRTAILDPRPLPARHAPGTAEFRYWTAAEALARGVNFWAPLLPAGTRWSTVGRILGVSLVAGQDLNAFYSRPAGLRFFQETVRNVAIFSGESPDVVCHELGHAVLDALRPQLFNAASIEVAAFHEAFGDMSGMLGALQLPTVRRNVLSETRGRLNRNSRLSRLAEQLGWGIRQFSPTAVDRDSLRNAANRFFYRSPAQLPPSAPASQLSSAPHSFSRVFTGAFLDALAGMLVVAGAANDPNLLAVSRDLGQLLVDGIRTAPVAPAYFSQVAAAMIQADQARNNGRYRVALSTAFIRHGILSPAAAAALANAPVPRLRAAPEPLEDMAAMSVVGEVETGAQTLLTYSGEGEDDGYRRGFEDVPELEIGAIPIEFGLDAPILAHMPDEGGHFAVAPAAPASGSIEAPQPEETALYFVEDLIRQGRVDLGPTDGGAAALDAPTADKTHELVDTSEGRLLERRYFDCGFCHGAH